MWFVVWNDGGLLVKGISVAYIKEGLIWQAIVCTKISHCDIRVMFLYVREIVFNYTNDAWLKLAIVNVR